MKSNKHFSRLLILLSLILYSQIGFAQNLVPNPSFEEYSDCEFDGFDLGGIYEWFRPSIGTSNWFNACDSSYCEWGVPDNKFGFNVPANSGEGYGGLYSFSTGGLDIDTREHLAVELITPLEAGHQYSIGFSVRLAKFSNCDANIAIHISDSVLTTVNQEPYDLVPNGLEVVSVNNQDSWQEFESVYHSTGGERYLTIGNFRTNENSTIDTLLELDTDHCLPSDTEYLKAYYLIDDVWVEEITVGVPSLDGSALSPISIYPNPAHTQFSFSSPFLSEYDAVQVRSMDGRVHIEHPLGGANQTIDVSRLARGSYFVHFVGKGRKPQAIPLILVEAY